MSALFWMRLPKNRREALRWRIRRFGQWAWWRQTPPLYRVTSWWLNRGVPPVTGRRG